MRPQGVHPRRTAHRFASTASTVATFVALVLTSGAAGQAAVPADDAALQALYARAVADLRAGEPLKLRVYVALCDNDSQGIVPVRNRAICDGERPDRNLYWASSGGLRSVLDRGGYRRVAYQRIDGGPVRIRARWRRSVRAGRRLRQLGAPRRFEVEIEALAYRGRHIREAMTDYLAEVHGVAGAPAPAHVVGYIGHNYLLDTDDRLRPGGPLRADAQRPRAVFALSCFGAQILGPVLARPATPVLVLNRSLTYPGAWTLQGLVQGLAAGADGRGIHRSASRAFALGKGRPPGSMTRVFAYGSTPRARRVGDRARRD